MCKLYCHKEYYDGERIITTPEQDDNPIVVIGIVFIWSILLSLFLMLTIY